MKRNLVFLFLLCFNFLKAALGQEKIIINSKALHFVDGTALMDIDNMYFFITYMLGMRFGFTPEVCHYKGLNNTNLEMLQKLFSIEKIFTLDGTRYTLKELVELEREFKKNNAHLLTGDHKRDRAVMKNFSAVLEEVIQAFEKVAEPYMEEVKGTKEFMVQLLEKWSEQANKPDTYLLAWSNNANDEKVHLRADLTSLEVVDEFLDDLVSFMFALIDSCPKSVKKYRKQLYEHHRAMHT